MNRFAIWLVGLLLTPAWALASGGGHAVHLDHVAIDVNDKASLQRGAAVFVNYCLSCHAAAYMRYSRLAQDLELDEELVRENLIFTGQKVGDPMIVAMPEKASKKWFGKAPPDLSVIARSRGADWLYTYLRGFYLDASRPVGVNNIVFPDVGMPHVLWELQGWQKPVHEVVTTPDGHEAEVIDRLEVVEPGTLAPQEYDRAMRDLVNYLVYMGEPAQLKRAILGPYVLGFLIIFTILAYFLKREYWRDIH
jgi:ubiquinol-cytochrome c reductase cytochrome c1 subunit